MKIKKITILSLGSFLLASSFSVASKEDEGKKTDFEAISSLIVGKEDLVLGLDKTARGEASDRILRFSHTGQSDVKIEDQKTQKFLVVNETTRTIGGNNLHGLQRIVRDMDFQQTPYSVELRISAEMPIEKREQLKELGAELSLFQDGTGIIINTPGERAIPVMRYIETDADLSEKVMVKLKGVSDEIVGSNFFDLDKQKIKIDLPFTRHETGHMIIDIGDNGKRLYSNVRRGEYLSLDPVLGRISTNSPVYAWDLTKLLEDKTPDAVATLEFSKFDPQAFSYAKQRNYPYYITENRGFGMKVPVSEAMKFFESRQRMSEEYLPGEVGGGGRGRRSSATGGDVFRHGAGTTENTTFTFENIPQDHVEEIWQIVDFGVSGREAFAIIGPNGAGKSTLFHREIPGFMDPEENPIAPEMK